MVERFESRTIARLVVSVVRDRVKVSKVDDCTWMCSRDGDRCLLVRMAADQWAVIGVCDELKNCVLAGLSAARLAEVEAQRARRSRDRGVVLPFIRKGEPA